MKILCLIIDALPQASWQETYATHRRVWHRCLDKCPEVDGYFLYSDPALATAHHVEGRRFTVRGSECHGTILFKTTRALEVLLASDHDYVVRTNISSLFDFPLLQRQDLPRAGLYSGHLVDGKYVTGSGMLLSRDVAQKLMLPVDPQLKLDAWDDAAIWQILLSHGVAPCHREAFIYDYARGPDQVSIGQHLHYRLREHGDPQRAKEREVVEHVFSRIYALDERNMAQP